MEAKNKLKSPFYEVKTRIRRGFAAYEALHMWFCFHGNHTFTFVGPPIINQENKILLILTASFLSSETFHHSSLFWTFMMHVLYAVGNERRENVKTKEQGVRDYGLTLCDEENDTAKTKHPNIRKHAREFLEYGENREGYWTRDKFIAHMECAVVIADIKDPKEEGWWHVWVFDHSSCHAAMADDALDVKNMNVRPGRKQRIMHDTVWNG